MTDTAKKTAAKPAAKKAADPEAVEKAVAPSNKMDVRGEILKIHRQLEALAGHINLRLPS